MKESRKRIHILLVVRHPIGGIRTYLKYLYNSFNQCRYRLTFLVPREYEKEYLVIDKDLSKFQKKVVFAEGKRLILFFLKLLNILRKGDIGVIHSQGTTCGFIVCVLNTLFRFPHIITFHETFDNQMFNTSMKYVKKRLLTFFISKANLLNMVSYDAKLNFLRSFPKMAECETKIQVITNGIDVELFSENINETKNIYDFDGIESDDMVMGFLGRYMPEKGFIILVDALDLMRHRVDSISNIKVLCLGWGEYIREYQKYIKEKDLQDHFVFIDFQSDIRWVLRQINVLVIPSMREAAPLLPMEAMVSGTPIIASDCIGLREITANTPSINFKAGDSRELALKIIHFINDEKKIKQAFAKYQHAAMARFDAKKSSIQLERFIGQLTNGLNMKIDPTVSGADIA